MRLSRISTCSCTEMTALKIRRKGCTKRRQEGNALLYACVNPKRNNEPVNAQKKTSFESLLVCIVSAQLQLRVKRWYYDILSAAIYPFESSQKRFAP